MTDFIGTSGDDIFPGPLDDNSGDDLIKGKGGDDILSGGDGNDKLIGSGGNRIDTTLWQLFIQTLNFTYSTLHDYKI